MLPGQHVQSKAGCSLREHGCVQSYVALEYKGVSPLLKVTRLPKVKRASHIRRAVKVLRPRIAEVYGSRVDDGARAAFRAVMDGCRARGRLCQTHMCNRSMVRMRAAVGGRTGVETGVTWTHLGPVDDIVSKDNPT